MRSRLALTTLCGGAAAVLLAAACSSDEAAPVIPTEAGTGGTAGAGAGGKGSGGKGTGGAQGGTAGAQGGASGAGGAGPDAGDAGDGGPVATSLCGGKTGADQITCGKYIVEHIDACGDCHSPRNQDGSIDMTKFLAGNGGPLFDIDPTDDTKGLVYPPNLTALKGDGWTAAEIKDAFLNGKRSAARGGNLVPVMPYANFHNMAAADADAIAAYILSLTPITNSVPADQPLPTGLDRATMLPIPPLDATKIPDTTLAKTATNYNDAVLGKYLAGELGICIECHTKHTQNGSLDTTKLFAGGEGFVLGGPFGTVTSLNITPATNGIKGWTAANVANVLKNGVDKDGMPLCPPMPFGPFGAFGGMTAAHQTAIGTYLTTIAGNENPGDGGRFPMCVMPSPPDGGTPDSGTPGDASTEGG